MRSNLNRFQEDLAKLIEKGDLLRIAMVQDLMDKKQFEKKIQEQLGKEKAADYVKLIPDFKLDYEAWYSEACALVKQVLPDRLTNFVSLYEKPKNRKETTYGNYVIQDFLQGLRVTRGLNEVVGRSAALPQLDQQIAIVKAAEKRFKSSLFDIKQLVQADLFDSELEGARELHKAKFFRAAGVIAGVVLEKHLKQVCSDHKLSVAKKSPTLSDLSEALKSGGAIDIAQWRFLSLLADIRNVCAHGKAKEPTPAQVSDLLDGVDKIIKSVN